MGPIQQMKALDKQIQELERVTLQKEHARVQVGLFFLVNLNDIQRR